MTITKKILIIGGGIGGMCAAIQLRKIGADVDLVEIDPEWRVYGAGLTISAPTLRALRTIGVLDAVMTQGATWEGLDFTDADGSLLAQIPIPKAQGADDVPATGAIMRPVFARILAHATRDSGCAVRLGVSFTELRQDKQGVDVSFTDGTQSRYDLVIGADGVFSQVRDAIFPDAPKPRYTGQGSWRAVVPRCVERASMALGARTKVGMNPVSDDEMYLYCLEQRDSQEFVAAEKWPLTLANLLAGFGGAVAQIRQGFEDGTLHANRIIYRPLQGLMVTAPWHLGRIVLIGDAVHATTPHLASGAGMAIEDAIVLASELSSNDWNGERRLEQALTRYVQRRYERCRLVVESSLRLGEIEQTGGSKEEHSQLMRSAMTALIAPI